MLHKCGKAMIVKVYGIVDLLAAAIIYLSDFGILNKLKILIIAVLLIKGIPSMLA